MKQIDSVQKLNHYLLLQDLERWKERIFKKEAQRIDNGILAEYSGGGIMIYDIVPPEIIEERERIKTINGVTFEFKRK